LAAGGGLGMIIKIEDWLMMTKTFTKQPVPFYAISRPLNWMKQQTNYFTLRLSRAICKAGNKKPTAWKNLHDNSNFLKLP
jgi:hypothetical protein